MVRVHRYGSRPQLKFTVHLREVYPKDEWHSREMSAVEVCNKYPESCSLMEGLAPGGKVEFATADGKRMYEVARVHGRLTGTHPETIRQRIDVLETERYREYPERSEERLLGIKALKPTPAKRKVPLRRMRRQAFRGLRGRGLTRREAAEMLYVAAGEIGESDE